MPANNVVFNRIVQGTKVDTFLGPEAILQVAPNGGLGQIDKGNPGQFLVARPGGQNDYADSFLTSFQVVANEAARLASGTEPNAMIKQSDNGITYWQTGFDPSLPASWVPIGDTAIVSDDIQGLIDPDKLATGTPSAKTLLNGNQQWVSYPNQLTYFASIDTATFLVEAGTTYLAAATAGGRQVFRTPLMPNLGDVFEVVGLGADGWMVAANNDSLIKYGDVTGGTLGDSAASSTSRYDSAIFRCVKSQANDYAWRVVSTASSALDLSTES